MTLAASAAQAESGAHWNVAGKSVTGSEAFQLEFKEVENKSFSFLFTTKSGTKVTILCTEVKLDEGGKLIAEGGVSSGRVLLKGCVTMLNGTISPACKPKSGGMPLGELLSRKFKGLIVLDKEVKLELGKVTVIETATYLKFTPEEGAVLFQWELGSECALGELVSIEAKILGEGLWFKEAGGDPCLGTKSPFEEEKVEHLFEESLHGLIALGQPLAIDSSFIMQLFNGSKWGGSPG
jgi:hypothetical protein